MGYPGDQDKPGGWPLDRPSQAPYGPEKDRPEEAEYGGGEQKNESPLASRDDAYGAPAASWDQSSSDRPSWDQSSWDQGSWDDVSWDEAPADRTRPASAPLAASPGDPLAAPAAPPVNQAGPLSGQGVPSASGPPAGDPEGQGGRGGLGGPPPGPLGGGPGPFGLPPGGQAPGRADGEGSNPYGPPIDNDPYGPPPGAHSSPGAYDDEPYADAHGFEAPGAPPGPGPGPGTRGGPTPPEKRRNLPLIIGGAAVAGLVLIGGGFGLSAVLKDDPKAKAGNTADTPKRNPAVKASPTAPVLEPVKLKSRATDPSPLSLNEIFGKKAFTAGGQKYVRTGWHAKRGCTGTVHGAKLTAVVKKGGCSQALRATFARGDGKLIGTVGVLNLKTEYAAKLAQRAAVAKDAFLQPLPGTGVSKRIGKGEALGTAEARGHYLLMTWVQRPDGKKIPDKYHTIVSTFGQQLIRGSNLSFALHYRETEGKPFRN